ncbi:MAG: ATP-binding protein [Candidatus Shapirobacteria bacterium]|jgi:signal transduction histidine kinase
MNCLELTKPFLYIFTDSVPNLLYYSHFPVAIVAIIIGFFIIKKVRDYKSVLFLFVINIVLALLSVVNIILWTNDRVENIMFFWFVSQLLFILLPLICLAFFYSFFGQERKIPNIYLYTWSIMYIAIVPIIVFSLNINYFDVQNCVVVENNLIINYQTAVLWIVVLWIFFSVVKSFFDKKISNIFKKEVSLLGVSLIFLLTILYFTWNSELFNIPFEYEQLGFIGLAIFLITLVFTVVKFKLFNIKLISTQALVWSVAVLVGSQLFFVDTVINTILVSITLLLSLVLGFLIIRSVKKEIKSREHIQKLADELEIAGEAQAETLRFITHQVKGVFTNTKGALSSILEGDYDPIPESLRKMVQNLFVIQNGGVDSVQAFLSASQLENGNPYVMKDLNFKDIVSEACIQLKMKAEKKGLVFETSIPDSESYKMKGDGVYLSNAILNIINNAVCYTKTGTIHVSLSKVEDKFALFSVKDTGVGITQEDGQQLFTKYGHGKDSRLINVDSNGLGLYLVKKIIDAHQGTVWYESEVGKGTTFFVKLPLA